MRIHTVKIQRTVRIEGDDPLAVAKRTVADPDDWEFWLMYTESNIPIARLDLPYSMLMSLRGIGITTVDELSQLTETELMACIVFGHAALDELREKLRVLGFRFQVKQ